MPPCVGDVLVYIEEPGKPWEQKVDIPLASVSRFRGTQKNYWAVFIIEFVYLFGNSERSLHGVSCVVMYLHHRYYHVKTGFVDWVWYDFIIIIWIKHGSIVYSKVFGCQVWMKGLLVCFVYRIEWEVLFGQRVADNETLNAIYWF